MIHVVGQTRALLKFPDSDYATVAPRAGAITACIPPGRSAGCPRDEPASVRVQVSGSGSTHSCARPSYPARYSASFIQPACKSRTRLMTRYPAGST